jgi:hypothetical protein
MRYIFLSVLLALAIGSSAQNISPAKLSVTIAFYNVENLFDITDDSSPGDDEFTPASAKAWDKVKYEKKLKDLAGTLGSISEIELPGLIGLAEVENKKVLEDLVKDPALRKGKI